MENFTEQLANVVAEYEQYMRTSKRSNGSDVIGVQRVYKLLTRAVAAIERIAGKSSVYFEKANQKFKSSSGSAIYLDLPGIMGIAESLLRDVESGYLKTHEELIHANVFSDFLEMSEYLLSQEYKDAAAVMIGSTLEVHLKKLATKYSVATESSGKPKKADKINAELAKAKVYSTLDQKNVTAWLDLRNKAAHGEYDTYDKRKVELMLDGIRNFMSKA